MRHGYDTAKRKSHGIESSAYVLSIKLSVQLIATIDREAEAEGLTRSAVIRRILIRNYSEPVEALNS